MKKRILSILLCLGLVLCAGCGAGQTADSAGATPSSRDAAASEAVATEKPDTASVEEVSAVEASSQEEKHISVEYPLCEPGEIQLEVYMGMAGFLPMVIPDVADVGLDETRGVQLLEEATGVDLHWTLIDQDAYGEKLSIVLASGDYPDFLGSPEGVIAGGIDSLIEQEICIDLMDYLDTCLVDFRDGIFSTNEEYRKGITTDAGHMSTVRTYENQSTMGMMIRQDWLDQLGLSVPETFEELHTVLEAFQNQIDGCEYPMLLTSRWDYANDYFVGGYDTSSFATQSGLCFFVEDGVVQPGILSDNYRDYIEMVRDWYAEGLIGNPTMYMNNLYAMNEYLTSNQTGFGFGQSDLLSESSKSAAGGTYDMEPIRAITRNKGDTFKLYANAGQIGNGGWAITTACEYPEEAAKVINWMWTEEGYNAMNVGVEGETYNLVDGEVQYTDIVLNNPNGFSAMFNSCSEVAFFDLPFDYSMERKAATFSNEAERKSQEVWRENTSNEMRYFGTMDAEETAEFNGIASDILTKCEEEVSKFVVGERDMSQWDTFREELRSMGIDRCTELRQAAYDRYVAR